MFENIDAIITARSISGILVLIAVLFFVYLWILWTVLPFAIFNLKKTNIKILKELETLNRTVSINNIPKEAIKKLT